jgi:uncharacterized protein (TIGR02594 family)
MTVINIKVVLFLGLVSFSTQAIADTNNKKLSKKEIEKYCNLSAQEKYSHLSKYCKMLHAKKVIPAIPFVSIINTSTDDSSSFFKQEKEKSESSQFFTGWSLLPTVIPEIKKKKVEVIDLNTNIPKGAVTVSQYQPPNQPNRRENPRPIINTEAVRIAREWEGYSVLKDRNELIKMLSSGNDAKVDPNRIPWCAAFINAVLKESGHEGTNSLTARSFLAYGTKVAEPVEGDIVIFKRGNSQELGHVAFFIGYEYINNKKYIKALGGNQKKSVNVALYSTDRLLGIRRI